MREEKQIMIFFSQIPSVFLLNTGLFHYFLIWLIDIKWERKTGASPVVF